MSALLNTDTPEVRMPTEVARAAFLPTDDPDDMLLTITELASYLRVPLGTIRKWREKGKGPKGRMVGKSLRFRFGDVRDWFESQPAS